MNVGHRVPRAQDKASDESASRRKRTGKDLWDKLSRGEKAELDPETGAGQAIEAAELT